MKQTPCPWSAQDDVFEGYVRGTLSPEERGAFEAHYFECDACAMRLEAYQGLHKALAAAAVVAGAPVREPVRARPWWWVAAPVAAGVVIVVAAATFWLNSTAPVTPETQVAVGPAPPSAAPPPPSAVAPPASATPLPNLSWSMPETVEGRYQIALGQRLLQHAECPPDSAGIDPADRQQFNGG